MFSSKLPWEGKSTKDVLRFCLSLTDMVAVLVGCGLSNTIEVIVNKIGEIRIFNPSVYLFISPLTGILCRQSPSLIQIISALQEEPCFKKW